MAIADCSTEVKTCSKCGAEKTKDQFFRNNKSSDGLQSACKDCQKPVTAAWRARNTERCREVNLAWIRLSK
jgi:hypothetical protein